jgi:hypothetical protein
LTKQRFSAITVKSMDIMHMIAGRDTLISTSKVKVIQTMKITRHPIFMVRVVAIPSVEVMPMVSLVECNVSQESPCDICFLDSGCNNHMT